MESAQEILLQHGLALRSKWMERITKLARPGLERQLILLNDLQSHHLNLLAIEENSFNRIQALQNFSLNISEVPYLFAPADDGYAEPQPNQGGATQKEDTSESTGHFRLKKLPPVQNADAPGSEVSVSPVPPLGFSKTLATDIPAGTETGASQEAAPSKSPLVLAHPNGNDENQEKDFGQTFFVPETMSGDLLQQTELASEVASFQSWFTKTPTVDKMIPDETTPLAYLSEETNTEHNDKENSPRLTYEPLKGLRQLGEWGQIHLSSSTQFDALTSSVLTAIPPTATEIEPDKDISTEGKLSLKLDRTTQSGAPFDSGFTPLSVPSENAPELMGFLPADFLRYNTQNESLALHEIEYLNEESKMPGVDELLEELQVRLNLEFNRYYTQ